MLSKPYRNISHIKIQTLAASKPTVSIVWLPSQTTKPEDCRMLIEKIPLALAQGFSQYCCDVVKGFNFTESDVDNDGHLTRAISIKENNGQACKIIFEWIQGHAAGFDLLDDYQFDIAPLHQAHGLLKAAEFLRVHSIRRSIWRKIDKIKKEPFRYSDAIPLLLTNAPGSDRYEYVLKGICGLIVNGWLAADEKNLMVIRIHYPLFAVELDEALEKKRIAAKLPQGPWNRAKMKNEVMRMAVAGSENPMRKVLIGMKRSRSQ